MFHRIRVKGPDGKDIKLDSENVPGPVGLMPKQVIHGWSLDHAAQTIKWGNGLQNGPPSERALYLREYRERQQA